MDQVSRGLAAQNHNDISPHSAINRWLCAFIWQSGLVLLLGLLGAMRWRVLLPRDIMIYLGIRQLAQVIYMILITGGSEKQICGHPNG